MHRPAQHLLRLVAQHARHRRVDERRAIVRIRHPDPLGGRLHDQAVALGAGVQRLLGALALRHVAYRDDGQSLAVQLDRRQVHHGREVAAVVAARRQHAAGQVGAAEQFARLAGRAAHHLGHQQFQRQPRHRLVAVAEARGGRPVGLPDTAGAVGNEHRAGHRFHDGGDPLTLLVGTLAGIAHRAADAQRLAFAVAFQHHAAHQHPAVMPVPAAHAELPREVGLSRLGRFHRGHVLAHPGAVVRVDVIEPLFARGGRQLVRLIAEDLAVARRQPQLAFMRLPVPQSLAGTGQREAGNAFGIAGPGFGTAQAQHHAPVAPQNKERQQCGQRTGGQPGPQRRRSRCLVQKPLQREAGRHHAQRRIRIGDGLPAHRIAVSQFDQRLFQQWHRQARLVHQMLA